MKLIDKVIYKVLTSRFMKESQTARGIIQYYNKQIQWTPREFKTYASEGYQMNVYVYSCINQITRNFAKVPWYLYQNKITTSGKVEEIESHPIIDILNKPNPYMGGTKFRENAIGYLMIDGNSYIERVGTLNKPPTELYCLRPDRVSIIPGDSQHMVQYFQYDIGATKEKIESPYILHLLCFNPLDDWYGQSPLMAASRSVDQNNEAKKWNVTMLQNDCVAPGILETEKNITDVQYDRLENKWRDKYKMNGEKYIDGTPIVLEGGLKWTAMGVSPKDMNWIEGSKMSAREIAIAYNVPSELIGDNTNKTYSNYKEARKALYEECIIPLLDWYKDELNNWLVPLYGNDRLYIDYDKDSIEALQEDRDSVWTRVNNATDLSVNEKRIARGYDELTDEEGGNLILVPTNVTPITNYIAQEPIVEDQPTIDNNIQPTNEEVQASKSYLSSKSAFNLNTNKEKTNYFKQYNIQREPYIKNAEMIVQKQFGNDQRNIKKICRRKKDIKGLEKELTAYIDSTKKNWKTIINGIYITVGEEFTKLILEGLKEVKYKYETKDLEDEIDIAKEVTLDWLKNNSAEKVVQITDTTKSQIRDELHKGVSEGESIPMLAARIDTLYLANIIPNRSTVIARTEVISASNLGSRAGALGLGIEGLTKEWLSASDNQVRQWHQTATGQNKEIEEPFVVMGENLMFPGDSSMGASPINVIQCRCCETYRHPQNI